MTDSVYFTFTSPLTLADAQARSVAASAEMSRRTGLTHETYLWPIEVISVGVWRLEVLHPALLTESEVRLLTGLPNELGNDGSTSFPSGLGGSLNGGGIAGSPKPPDAG